MKIQPKTLESIRKKIYRFRTVFLVTNIVIINPNRIDNSLILVNSPTNKQFHEAVRIER